MATFNYARSANTADRLIKRFGQSSTLTRMIAGTGPAHNPGPSTPNTHPVVIAPLPIERETGKDGVEPGSMDLSKFREFYLSPKAPNGTAIAMKPQAEDLLSFDGYSWTIKSVAPLNPGAIDVYYHGECKRS